MRLRALIRAGGIAGCLVLANGPVAATVTFPWGANDKPPAIDGVKLGDTEQHAIEILGAPDQTNPTTNGDLLEYTTKGLELTATKAGIIAIRLRSPGAGSIGDIKVGDKAREVIVKWGAPKDGQDRTAIFGTANWVVFVELADADATVVDMTLAWANAKPADASPLNTFQTH